MADGSRGIDQMESFRPGPGRERALRDAFGGFATGVTVITCRDGGGPLAITANSFSSVSLDPPLVLWSPAVASSRHDAFVAARRFAVHVLRDGQLPLCRSFAKDGRDFADVAWRAGPEGLPLLEDCLARFECRHFAAHGAGDHTILIGLVEAVATGPGAPLVFCQGSYGRFTNGA